ncbi:hypothetical protein GCM10010123_21640 [Pilimelia anulata]|uniref:Mini-circle protein n=1 Tax=Pilimelia anulata TaxID=53371 RepID=A0A8J3FAA1_9ACTN|nr:DinB family protein [Pilimelia anulata]GGJ91490.1 hypothetical protein GCM10010123_21640 [Pilimelia anulata]
MDSDVDPVLDGPGLGETGTWELLVGYLRWYRAALHRKLEGLTDAQLRTPLPPVGWAPLALVQHLGWMEQRWLVWGFRGESVPARPPGGAAAEWRVELPTDGILAGYAARTARSDAILAGAAVTDVAAVGGRFSRAATAPSLGRILAHMVQEYARHVGQLDIVRELIDGRTGE